MAGPIVGERTLRETPTWAVALVCAVFVIISIIIEHSIHSLGKWFQRRQKKAMTEALEKIKAELMLLGFLSLLITVGTKPVSKICIPASLGGYMLPCKKEHYSDDGTPDSKDSGGDDGDSRRRLLGYAGDSVWRRGLAAPAGGDDYCSKDGKIPLVSASGIHQLHLLIFALALFHVLYSVVTIALAKAKLRKWKSWEKETSSLEYQFTNDPSRFRLTHQTSFVKRHTGLSTTPGIRWIVAFFRQFFASVTKVDYLTMRHGFINAHFAPDSKFDFHRYIKRSMEDDFKVVVGVSIPLWICSLLFLLLNVYGWYTLSIISFTPLIILLIVGAKLEIIIMEMAQQIQDRTTVVKGAPVVEPTNKFFWFNRPGLILFLIHFTLFQNAFQMAYFLWIVYEFKLESCFHENLPEVLIRVCLGVALQILCSYITFPLYALVTQMGSHMKKAIFEEQTTRALKNWQKAARQRNKIRKSNGENSVSGLISGESTPSRGSSPLHLLHKHKPVSSLDLESAPPSPISSPRFYRFDADTSEIQERPVAPASGNGQESRIQINNQPPRNVETHAPNRDFSFSRSLN